MISYLQGKVRRLNREPPMAVIVAGGVGYDVHLPVVVYQALVTEGVKEGEDVELEIFYNVTERQPKPYLVGFRQPAEREFFEQLIEVEGIGPARAAQILVMPVSSIASAIETEDMSVLTRLPGVGQRGAQKMVATLKGKVAGAALARDGVEPAVGARTEPDAVAEAIEALVALGYRGNEAREAVDDAIRRNKDAAGDVEDLMREVFRSKARLEE